MDAYPTPEDPNDPHCHKMLVVGTQITCTGAGVFPQKGLPKSGAKTTMNIMGTILCITRLLGTECLHGHIIKETPSTPTCTVPGVPDIKPTMGIVR